jgi:30S ribosomal protein S31
MARIARTETRKIAGVSTGAEGYSSKQASGAFVVALGTRLNWDLFCVPGASRLDLRARYFKESICMGKGDRKTRRGKIYRGSFGKSRPKDPAKQRKKAAAKK